MMIWIIAKMLSLVFRPVLSVAVWQKSRR